MIITHEQLADMVAMHETRGLAEIGVWVGLDPMTVSKYLYRYGGVTPRSIGQYAANPRLNDGATDETWRCVTCGRGTGDGVRIVWKDSAHRYRLSYCNECIAARQRERYAVQGASEPRRCTRSSGNVFADLGLPDAARLLLWADLIRVLRRRLVSRGVTL